MRFYLSSFFLFVVIFCSIYQDFPLVNFFGEIARSPIVFLTPLMLFSFLFWRKIYFSFYSKNFLLYISYLIIISGVFIGFFYMRLGTFSIFNENVVVKTIKMLMYPLVAFILYLYVYSYLKRNPRHIFVLAKQVYLIQIVLFLFLLIESAQNADGITIFQDLHANPVKYWRIRLLTLEASWSGTVVVVFSLLPIYFAINNFLRTNKVLVYLTSTLFLIFYTFLSGSKGYLLLFVFSLAPNIYSYLNNSRYKKYIYIILIVGVVIFGFNVAHLYEKIFGKFYISISFGTRITSFLSGIRLFVLHPLGVGFGSYMYYYTESIKSIISLGWTQQFNLNEIVNYLSTAKSLSTKTYFFDQLLFGGIGFLFFFYNFYYLRYKKLLINKSDKILKVILIFVVLSGVFYITYHVKYEVWLFLAVIDFLETNKLKLEE